MTQAPNHSITQDQLSSLRRTFLEASEKLEPAIQLGRALASLNHLKEAEEVFREAVRMYPESRSARVSLAEIVGAGDVEAASALLMEVEKLPGEGTEEDASLVDVFANLAARFAAAGQPVRAKELFDKALALAPDDPDLRYRFGNFLDDEGQYTASLAHFEKAAELRPNDINILNNYALAVSNAGRQLEAVSIYKKALAQSPQDQIIHFNLGNAYCDLRNYDDAIAHYENAIRISPNFADAYYNLAYVFWRQGRYSLSKDYYGAAHSLYEKQIEERRFDEGDVFERLGKTLDQVLCDKTGALKVLLEGHFLFPQHIGILEGLITLYADNKKRGIGDSGEAHWKAWGYYRKLNEILEDKFEKEAAALLRGQLLLLLEQLEEAESQFNTALDTNPSNAEVNEGLGAICILKGEFAMAIRHFSAAKMRDPDSLQIRTTLAEVYCKSEMKEKAESEYREVLSISNHHVGAYLGLAEVHTLAAESGDSDQYEHAIQNLNQALRLSPSKEGSRKLLGRELSDAYYARGYSRVKLFESAESASTTLLQQAAGDFRNALKNHPQSLKAERALTKLQHRAQETLLQNLTEKWGPLVLVPLSLIFFFLAQWSYYIYGPREYQRQPERKPTAAKPAEKAGTVAASAAQPPAEQNLKPEENPTAHEVKPSGEEAASEADADDEGPLPPGLLSAGYYVSLTLGSLMLFIAAICLPKIQRLSIAGVELEKTAVEVGTRLKTLGISR